MLSTEIQETLLQIAGLILAGISAWVLTTLRGLIAKQGKVADEKLSEQFREKLYPALNAALDFARASLTADERAKLEASDKLKARVIATAADYIEPRFQETLPELGITRAALEEMLAARLQSALDYLKGLTGK